MDSTKVNDCVDDALADLERQGSLSLADVQRLIDLHDLSGAETLTVFHTLRDQGALVDDDDSAAPEDQAPITIGRSSRDTLDLMMRAAGRINLLTAEEEVRLGRRIRIGQSVGDVEDGKEDDPERRQQVADGKRAHDQLVLANLRLVASIARRYQGKGMDLPDLIQEGTIGVMRAADKFDHTLGFKFSTYATWWIRQAITRALADKGRLIRLPVHVVEKMQRVRKVQTTLRSTLTRDPSLTELATELGEDPANVQAVLDLDREPISLDAPVGDDANIDLAELLDFYSVDVAEEVVNSMTRDEIGVILEMAGRQHQALAKGASAHAFDMLKLRYGLDDDRERTLDEVGSAYGVTRERARQILNKTLASPELKELLAELA